ncbi:EAL domain-containing protein [Neisseria sp. Ec49-e6-T10]|uniref:EAL domain-containing protein n=1 Tax=Neisseria sp. Ec49-e6-T10 TaxID=3140744 RepID=UPI003EBA0597
MFIKKLKSIIYQNIIPILIFLVIIMIGLSFIHTQMIRRQQILVSNTNALMAIRLEQVLISSKKIGIDLSDKLALPCNDIRSILQQEVAISPNVRSLNLVHHNKIYCSSIFDIDKIPETDPIPNTDHPLYLTKATILTKDSPLVNYQYTINHHQILTVFDGRNLMNFLRPEDPDLKFTLYIGKNRINEQGMFNATTHPALYYTSTHHSEYYPFKITMGVINPITPSYFLRKNSTSVILLLLFALCAGWISRIIITNLYSPSSELKRAIAQEEFIPYVQPIFCAQDNRLIGIEVLARWQHPREGLIAPDLFIPLAESTGLIKEITKSLMKQTSVALQAYRFTLPDNFHVGFNISAKQGEDFGLIQDCKDFKASLKPAKILFVVELTERELLEQNEKTKELFRQLHQLNLKVALDDFGIGNSSLSYLHDLKIDYLKIDKSFVAKIQNNALSKQILDSIIELAQKIGLESVAEGVENEAQADYLKSKGVNFLQGYLYSKPVPIGTFLKSKQFTDILKFEP